VGRSIAQTLKGFMLIRATAGVGRLAAETLEPLGIDARH
jgi:hypothetical protein